MDLTCEHCGHDWDYKGDSKFFATCPSCLRKVNIVLQMKEEA
jgi:predicted  nucleic acid-binding Zn-ribbon protein